MISAMPTILILLAHPAIHHSRIHAHLTQAAQGIEGVVVHDLYETYPDFFIHKNIEQDLLRQHDLIILQFPMHWYSAPALLHEWRDLVLEFGFAYGKKGNALRGKQLMVCTSTGGKEEAYTEQGEHGYPVHHYLFPYRQLAQRCQMTWLEPFIIQGSFSMDDSAIPSFEQAYVARLQQLRRAEHLEPGDE